MSTLFSIASATHSADPTTKPLHYYKKYQHFLSHHGISPRSILEIGTYQGESTKVFSRAFPEAKIVALDIELRNIDFSAFPNITYLQADQTKAVQLAEIILTHFPEGIDLVIEDASHFGYFSKLTFDAVFPFVKKGGAYFIEDWGTGYWDSFLDGSRFQEFPIAVHANNLPKRLPSHDFGMVGFVKSLVDLTHETAIKTTQQAESKYQSRIDTLEFGEGICMALKA
jgi:hypothetical protein